MAEESLCHRGCGVQAAPSFCAFALSLSVPQLSENRRHALRISVTDLIHIPEAALIAL